MTDARLDDLDRLANGATAGPWYADDGAAEGFDGSWDVCGPDQCGIASITGTALVARYVRDKEANANFIAASRTAVPELVAEVRRLRAIVDKLPKTADGVPIVPGMEVYRRGLRGAADLHTVFMVKACHWVDDAMIHFGPRSPIYSTRDAALAALSPTPAPAPTEEDAKP